MRAACLRAVPRLDRGRSARLATIDGAPPNLLAPPRGCRFHPRCRFAISICQEDPPFVPRSRGHLVACHRVRRDRGARPDRRMRPAEAAKASANGSAEPILDIRGTSKFFPIRAGLFRRPLLIRAVNDVTLDIKRGETLGLVGESGCGKSTLGRLVLRLDDPTAGEIRFEGVDLSRLRDDELLAVRKRMQVIFQDPYSSLNPRMTVGQIIAEPMRVHRILPRARDRGPGRRSCSSSSASFPYMARALPARAVGRPAPARRHRPGALGEPARHRLRRGRSRALDVSIQGQVHQPAGGAAAEARAHLSLHRPRPRRGAPHLDPGGGDVPRPHRRGGRRPTSCSPTPSTPTPRPCWRRRPSPIR